MNEIEALRNTIKAKLESAENYRDRIFDELTNTKDSDLAFHIRCSYYQVQGVIDAYNDILNLKEIRE